MLNFIGIHAIGIGIGFVMFLALLLAIALFLIWYRDSELKQEVDMYGVWETTRQLLTTMSGWLNKISQWKIWRNKWIVGTSVAIVILLISYIFHVFWFATFSLGCLLVGRFLGRIIKKSWLVYQRRRARNTHAKATAPPPSVAPVQPSPSQPPAASTPVPPPGGPPTDSPEKDFSMAWAYWINGIILALEILWLIYGLVLFYNEEKWSLTLVLFNKASFAIASLMLHAVYTRESLHSVNLDRQGMLLFFGRFIRFVKPGPEYVPLWICKMVLLPTTSFEKDLPADPRLIYKGDATKQIGGTAPPGTFPALRITFATGPEEPITFSSRDGKTRTIPKDDAYAQRNTAEIEVSYSWHIDDSHKFCKRFGLEAPEMFDKAQSQMDDTAIGTIMGIFQLITAAEALTLVVETNGHIEDALRKRSEEWGITVEFVRITNIGFSHDTNKATSLAADALQKKKATITDSQATREKLTNEGLGKARAAYHLLAAEADGARERAEVAALPGGQFAMAIDVIGGAIIASKAFIVDGNNLLGSIASVKTLLDQLPGTPASQPDNSGNSVVIQAPVPVQPSIQTPAQPPRRESRYAGKKDKGNKK